MIFLLGEVAAEVVMMVVMFPLPGCPLPPGLLAEAAVMIALASGFLGIDDSKSWSMSSSSSCRD